MPLSTQHCVSCVGGLPRLGDAEVARGLAELPGWALVEGGRRLARSYRFRDFREAMRFVDALAALAEQEGHHPDFAVHWNRVEVVLWTHDAGGLTENDLVLAARLGDLPEGRGAAPA
jgi:4a-hydroxytetrahydrobiopterin dehydratase